MREKKITALIMSIFMVLSLLPSTVFAAAAVKLDGQLKINGKAAVGTTLSAELKDVKPEGLADGSISYKWSRKPVDDTENAHLQEIGKEKTYVVTEADLGCKIVLTITGAEDKGYTGSLNAETADAVAPAESQDQPAPDTQAVPETEEQDAAAPEVPAEEVPETDIQTEEEYEEIPAEESGVENAQTDELLEEVLEPEEQTGEAGSESVEGIPAAQEDGTTELYPAEGEDQFYEDDSLTPVDPSEMEDDEAGSEEVDGIPPAQEDDSDQSGEGNQEVPDTADPVYLAEVHTPDGTGVLDFGTLPAGETADGTSLNVAVKNTGTETLHFLGNSPEHFAVQDIVDPLEPGAEVVLWVAPRQGTAAGTYEDVITYSSEEGAQASFTARMVLTEAEKPEVPALAADQEFLGFTADEAQILTLTNNSSKDISLTASTAEGTVIVDPSTVVIPAGGNYQFQIVPADGLEAEKEYQDNITFTDEANAENTVTIPVTVVLPPEVPDPISDVTSDRDSLDFGTETEGYQEAPAEDYAVLTNNGEAEAELSDPVSENGEAKYFDVLLADSILPAGGTTHLIIRPKTGLAAGNYKESFTVTDLTAGKDITITAVFSVSAASHSLSVDPASLEFPAAKKGYNQIEAQQITVTNNGTAAETLTQPMGSAFDVSQADTAALTIQPGESVSFTVRPKAGLDIGTYQETIQISSGAATVGVNVVFQVIKGTATITKIQTPENITGLANGTKKDAKSLRLPSVVVIETTSGNMKAAVTWDVKSCSYDPSNTEKQTFSVSGTVKLPEGVDNNNKLPLSVKVKVSVKAYAPRTVSSADNKITGIEYNGNYTTQSKISFAAVGAGMDNTSPRKGDTRYLPLNWTVINTNTWSSAPYTASFGMAQSGDYTLKVTFQLQKFDGASWKSIEDYASCKVPFHVSKASVTGPGQNLTPAANRRNAVRTGDSTPVLPFVIILVVAAVAIGGVIIYKKKK
ncbi:hypothetical protein [Blautia sp.]|jgi:hypothetical protein|uniref:hypothetical protein n=1 Tax=Blautia sp. TaxID=1955243 RepID=UPI003D8FE892